MMPGALSSHTRHPRSFRPHDTTDLSWNVKMFGPLSLSYAETRFPNAGSVFSNFPRCRQLAPRFYFHPANEERIFLLTGFTIQVTQRRVPTSSKHDVLNATLSARVKETRLVPICTGCSDATLVQSQASHTLMPIRQRALNGTKTLW
jgi:hypothetical protein